MTRIIVSKTNSPVNPNRINPSYGLNNCKVPEVHEPLMSFLVLMPSDEPKFALNS